MSLAVLSYKLILLIPSNSVMAFSLLRESLCRCLPFLFIASTTRKYNWSWALQGSCPRETESFAVLSPFLESTEASCCVLDHDTLPCGTDSVPRSSLLFVPCQMMYEGWNSFLLGCSWATRLPNVELMHCMETNSCLFHQYQCMKTSNLSSEFNRSGILNCNTPPCGTDSCRAVNSYLSYQIWSIVNAWRLEGVFLDFVCSGLHNILDYRTSPCGTNSWPGRQISIVPP